jgi:Zn-dependent oligopeptidase
MKRNITETNHKMSRSGSKRTSYPETRLAKRRRRERNVPTAPVFTSAREVHSDYKATIAALKRGFKEMKKYSKDPLHDYAQMMTQAYNRVYPIMLSGMTSPNKKVRDACTEVEEKWGKDALEVTTDHELYLMLRDQEIDTKNKQDKSLKESFLDHMRHSGAHFQSERRRKEIRSVQESISTLETHFQKNFNENTDHLMFDTCELQGCSEAFIKRTQQDDGRHKIVIKTPDILPVMESCSVASTREQVYTARVNKCGKENTPVFHKLRKERGRLARIMGRGSYPHHAMENTMAGNPVKVEEFLQKLMGTLKPVVDEELDELSKLKLEEEGFDKLEIWDYSYYLEKYRQRYFSVDQNEIKEYFPTEVAYPNIMHFYEDILGLRFEEVELPEDKKWHPSVRYFATYDRRSNEIIGYFYLDMYPRDGKYPHACCSSMRSGTCDGTPIGLLIMNCDTQMDFYTVETFFHEFGHVMHQICSGYKCKYSELDWETVTTDFVEAPSQMMENWCYEPEVITRVSSHYVTGEPMPKDLVKKMASVRKVGQAYQWLRVSIDALTDILAHRHVQMPLKIWQLMRMKLQRKWVGFAEPRESHYYAAWTHMGSSEYASKYWSYVWAKVIAADLYTPFQKHGVTSKWVGEKYRRCILQPGGSEEEEDMVWDFLGRDFTVHAFVDSVSP